MGTDPSLGLDAFLRGVVLDDTRLGRLARAAPDALQQLAQQLPQVVAILPQAAGPAAVRSIVAACWGDNFVAVITSASLVIPFLARPGACFSP